MKLEDIVLFDRKDNDLLCSVLSTDLENKLEHATVLAVETDDIAKILYCRDVKSYVIVTKQPEKFAGKFIANNIIDASSKKPEKILKDILWVLSSYGADKTEDVFFTSDTHFNHKNIIRYCNRPWNDGKDVDGQLIVSDDNVKEMNEAIITAWNKVVPPNALVWHLGDFALGDRSKIPEIVARLNGRINLVLGNHDHKDVKRFFDAGFNRVYDHPVLINKFVVLTHEPLEFLNANCPFFQIFGHVHDSEHYQTWSKTGACVCVERHDYAPVPWTKIQDKYKELNGKD